MIWRKEEKSWYWGILSARSPYLPTLLFFFSLIKHWNLLHLIKISEGNRLVTPDLSETYVPENRYIVRHITANDRSCLEKAEKASTYAVNIVGYHTTNNLLIMTYLTSNHRIKN